MPARKNGSQSLSRDLPRSYPVAQVLRPDFSCSKSQLGRNFSVLFVAKEPPLRYSPRAANPPSQLSLAEAKESPGLARRSLPVLSITSSRRNPLAKDHRAELRVPHCNDQHNSAPAKKGFMKYLAHSLVCLLFHSIVLAQAVTADFGNRTSTAYPIPSTLLGLQYSNHMPTAPLTNLYNGGFRLVRTYAWIQSVYASKTPNWRILDGYLSGIAAANVGKNPGFHVLLEMTYTPPWLVPTVQGCSQPGSPNAYHMPPSNVATWASLAASVVAHVDQKFPGVVTDYEIWNEPELGYFCTYPDDAQTRANAYMAIYAAAAAAIRAQALKDGKTVRIGGPAITSTGATSYWIGGLVNNPATAPYVDFVSYHKYPSGASDITGGMTWDQTSPTSVASLYSRIQSTSISTGFAANYLAIYNAIKGGKQPNPTRTRIYLDEYNDNWAFTDDCCRNTATYSPLFNGLIVVDMLDTIYRGAAHVPDGFVYYSASNPPFCLFGDTSGHCNASNYNTGYPQFYLYELLGSSNYLDLSDGGYMASSVSPQPSTSGLAAAAFWTPTGDHILIVNPTSTNYTTVNVQAVNTGFPVNHLTAFVLNNLNRSIAQSKVTPIAQNNTYTIPISVAAYSVVALKFAP